MHVCVHLFVRRLKDFSSSISLSQEQMIQFNTAAKIPYQLRADAINPSVSPQRHSTSSWIYLQPPSPLFSYNQFILKQFGCHPGVIKLFQSAVTANLTQSPRKKNQSNITKLSPGPNLHTIHPKEYVRLELVSNPGWSTISSVCSKCSCSSI